jgi:pyruvate dehydrogenase E1 component beta subunit
VPIGKAKVLREGSDVTILAFSIMVGKALEAAEALAAEGISAEVVDLRSLRPLDIDTIVESEIAAIVMEHAFDWLDAPVARVAGLDVPLPYAANLEKLALPQTEHITEAAKSVCYRS